MKGHQWQWFYKIEQDFSFYLSVFLFLLELGSLNGVGLILMEQWSVSKVWVYIVHLRGSVRKINFVYIRQSELFFRSEFWNPAGFVQIEIFLTNQIVSDERKMKQTELLKVALIGQNISELVVGSGEQYFTWSWFQDEQFAR